MARDVTTTFNAWSFGFTAEEEQILLLTGNAVPDNSLELTVPKLILAGAYSDNLTQKLSLTGEINLDVTTDKQRNVLISANPVSVDPHLGVELGYSNIVFLRGGIGNIQRHLSETSTDQVMTMQINLGVGLKMKSFAIDYAYTDLGNQSQSLYSHVFS
jgi:hypothetical protein